MLLMEERELPLNDSLVKAAVWTHTNVKQLGYIKLQLVTGESYNLLGLTIGDVAIGSISETKALQKVKTIAKFREGQMGSILKNCQIVMGKVAETLMNVSLVLKEPKMHG